MNVRSMTGDSRRPVDDNLTHAVVGSPDSTHAIELPADRSLAKALQVLHRNSFWCGTGAGGCGQPMILNAGQVRIPYFRHHPGTDCAHSSAGSGAARSYEHLHFQHEIVVWLEKQGLTASAEFFLGPDGRADVHVIVDGRDHTIEVQLSPIGFSEWQRRDEQYRARVHRVTWLYGPGAEAAASTEQAGRGYVLHLRRSDTSEGRCAEVGVVTHLNEAWSPLSECELRGDLFWTPDLDQALVNLARAREEEEVAQKRAKEAAEAAITRQHAAVQFPSKKSQQPVSLPSDRTEACGTVAWWESLHPELSVWSETQDWEWVSGLSHRGRSAARVAAYIVSNIYLNGPISRILLLDEEAGVEVVAAMEAAGLLRQYELRGVKRWERS